MNKKPIIAVLSSVVAFSAQANDVSGFYFQGKLGTSIPHQSNRYVSTDLVDYDNKEPSFSIKQYLDTKTKAVFAGGVAAGFDFNPQFNVPLRLEVEFIARAKGSSNRGAGPISSQQRVDFVDGTFVDGTYTLSNGKASVSTQTWMVNSYYDIDTATPWRPYLSLGVGLAHNRLQSGARFTAHDRIIEETWFDEWLPLSQSKTRFAWSVGAGVAYDFNKNWSVDLAYRFLDAGSVSGTLTLYDPVDNEAIHATGSAKVRYHDILAGLRYTF
ncbi:porin family protein [Serratia fonticola]|uniref:outer membrane protein n=1 Tax=Serratia fonticola TaxID=47917 RepID=UPI0015C64110|nr:outer membrane beta-barrel protein [Serratia fonticola]MBC3377791.1 porin family protein [Serratia fonticola]NYA36991.1 porin family protein [Serratia fonticola]